MKAIENPNYWSCLPTAFAMALDKPVSWVIQKIGHPGAEEPYGVKGLKAGFHEQECIEVAQGLGFACTPIQLVPTISPYHDKRDAKPIYFGWGMDDNWVRFLLHLREASGVITGVYKKDKETPAGNLLGHAVAWSHEDQLIYDPIKGRKYNLTESQDYRFYPRCFWKIQKVDNGKTSSETEAMPD